MEERLRRQLAFVVKLWHEPGEQDGRWRGVVQSLDGERRRYFSDLSDVVEFVRASMKAEANGP
jgi:hypothetical protein